MGFQSLSETSTFFNNWLTCSSSAGAVLSKIHSIFDSIECIFDNTAPAEEEQVNQLLKKVLVSERDWKPIYHSYLKTRSLDSLEKAIQTLDTSPEIISCLLRLEKRDVELEEPIT